jgi:hypothetical protein
MGLVNSPSFPTAGQPEEPVEVKKPKGKAATAPVEIPEECCALGCDDCKFENGTDLG